MIESTPLEPAPAGLAPGREIWLKREDTHELGAFKWRGALPTLSAWHADGVRSVVTASTGNHGAATAWAARELGLQAFVYVPRAAPVTKRLLIESLGGHVREHGADLDEAKDEARTWAAATGLPFFEDGREPHQYDGYEAIASEIVAQLGREPGAVVTPVGNGALAIGIGRALGRLAPRTLRVGVVPAAAPVMADSLAAGRPVEATACATFADGLAIRVAIPDALASLAPVIDRVERVTERAMARAVGLLARAGIRVEGSGAAALAALPALAAADPIVLVVTGRNIDEELHRRAVEAPETFPG